MDKEEGEITFMKRKGIRAMLALLLMAILMISSSVPALACHDYTRPQTAKYTVYYREHGSNKQLAPSVTKSATVDKTVTESAIEIRGYTVYGQSTQSLHIRSGYCNTITFYYQRQTDYYVRYLEYGTEEVLAPEKHVENQTVGSVVTETAIDIEGYRLVGSDTQTLELKACGTSSGSTGGSSGSGSGSGSSTGSTTGPVTSDQALQIALSHAGLSSSSVRSVEIEKDREHGVWVYEVEFKCQHGYEYEYDIECSTGKILSQKTCSRCGNSSSSSISGLKCSVTPTCYPSWPSCPVTPTCYPTWPTCPVTPTPCPGEDTEACNVITFYYEKIALADYTVKYLDKDTNEPVAADKVQTGLEVGTIVTETAIPVGGYAALDPTGTTLVLAETGNEIIFYYQKLTTYTIHYCDFYSGEEIEDPKTVTDVPVGETYTEYAIYIPRYKALEDEITFTLMESGNDYYLYYDATIL